MERWVIIIQFQNRKRWYCDWFFVLQLCSMFMKHCIMFCCFYIAFYFTSRPFFSSYLVHLLHSLQAPFRYFSIINDFRYFSFKNSNEFSNEFVIFSIYFSEPWHIGFSTGRIAHHFIVWIAFVFADTMLWSETENGSFNYQFESHFVCGNRFVLCSHWFRHVSMNIN